MREDRWPGCVGNRFPPQLQLLDVMIMIIFPVLVIVDFFRTVRNEHYIKKVTEQSPFLYKLLLKRTPVQISLIVFHIQLVLIFCDVAVEMGPVALPCV